MKLHRTICFAFAALFAGAAWAEDPKVTFEKYTLKSGMEVILHQDSSVPLVAVNVWWHVASGDETPGKSGFAHLFEHMMFQGAQHIGEDVHFEILKKIGATGINGTTNLDRTNYFEVVPAHHLETALWLESDRMGYMLPMLNEKSLANQRDVVRNERRQSYDNRPYGKELFAVMEGLYAEGHPYRYMTIGRHEDIEGASLADVRGFFKQWYVPSNATLVLAGDFEPVAAKKLIEKWFGSFPAPARPEHRIVLPTPLASNRRSTLSDPLAKLRRVRFAWHSPPAYREGDAEFDILASVLGEPGTGRLYKILVHEKQLVQMVSAMQRSAGMSGLYTIVADLRPGADQAQVEAILDEQIEEVMRNPVTQREFDRAVTGVKADLVWQLEGLMARAELLQGYNHFVGTPDYITQDLDRYRKSSPKKVHEAAARYLAKKQRVEVITLPAEGGTTP